MSYAFHRSQRHGPNRRYFPELQSHPNGMNKIAPELNTPLDPSTFGPLLMIFTKPGSARHVQFLLSMLQPDPSKLSLFCPLTPQRWLTKDLSRLDFQKEIRSRYATRYKFHPDRSDLNTHPNDPELELQPTLHELFSRSELDGYIRLTQRISELYQQDRPEAARKLLARADQIPIKMNLQCQPIFNDVLFVGLPTETTATREATAAKRPGEADQEAFSQKNGAQILTTPSVGAPSRPRNGLFEIPPCVPFSADPSQTRPLGINTDHLGMSQTDLARKYNVPLVGRRLRRRDEDPFENPNSEVQPDAWWDDPYSYLPAPSKKYLPPPKAYVEWLSEEQALLTPQQLRKMVPKLPTNTPLPNPNDLTVLRSTFEAFASEILDFPSIRSSVRGFYFVKDQYQAMSELRAIATYLYRHRPHPKNEQKAGRLLPLSDYTFWTGLTRPAYPFLLRAALEPNLLDLGPPTAFSEHSPFNTLLGLSMTGFEHTTAYHDFLHYTIAGKKRAKHSISYIDQRFRACMPTQPFPEGCEPVLLKFPAIQQILIATVPSDHIIPLHASVAHMLGGSVPISTIWPSTLEYFFGAGKNAVLARNGLYNSKTLKCMNMGDQPDNTKLLIDMFRKAMLAFGIKPAFLSEILNTL